MEDLIVLEGNELTLQEQTNNKLVMLENQIKELSKIRDDIRERIKNEMIEKKIYKLENDEISITLIDETERETFDTKKFKEERPSTYAAYLKTTKVAATVRFKVK